MNQSALRIYRERSNLTLEQLGALLGVNKSTILRWENGQVPAERVIQIEAATGLPRYEQRPDLYPSPPTAPVDPSDHAQAQS